MNCTAKRAVAAIQGYDGECIIKYCMFEGCNFSYDLVCNDIDGVFTNFNGRRYATFESNCSDKSEGLSRICKASLAQMQKAREEESKKK